MTSEQSTPWRRPFAIGPSLTAVIAEMTTPSDFGAPLSPNSLTKARGTRPVFVRGQEHAFANQLNVLLRQEDSCLMLAALGQQARARGMRHLAKQCGVTREGLYRSLNGDARPRFDTVVKVMRALGFELVVRPASVDFAPSAVGTVSLPSPGHREQESAAGCPA